ncbi:MAG: 50S ribosomal protein L18 [Candidatus Pacebacteria bacterium]|nr:50S ribosomal protein L18 [Candidatus Paceibacterota bacterium]
MNKSSIKQEKRVRRHHRIRAKVQGTAECPRLAVYRSNTALYAQLIDDVSAKTIASVDSRKATGTGAREKARFVGTHIAEKAKGIKVTKVVFDRGGFLYAGTIKELADSARTGGLIF